jgi:hypothetical protein
MAEREQDPQEDGAKLNINQKVYYLWLDRPKLHGLLEREDERLARGQWRREFGAGAWRIVAATAVLVGIIGGLKGLGVLDAVRKIFAP